MLGNKRPSYFWLNGETLRFAFDEEISQHNVQRLQQLERFIMEKVGLHVMECVAGYYTLTVFLRKQIDVEQLLGEWERATLEEVASQVRRLRIPVCYEAEFALDLERMEKVTGLSAADIVRIHSEAIYTVFMIGFLPGFPYLGGLDERLAVPRLAEPRLQVTAGSVGIGGAQTGVYPIDSPGGWHIIGRTPLRLFDTERAEPFLFAPGDEVQFVPINVAEFRKLKRDGVSGWHLY